MKIFPTRAFLVVMGLVLVIVVTACDGTSSTGATPSTPTPTTAPTPTPTTAPTPTPTTAPTPTSTTAPTPTPTTASTFTVKTAQATVKGKVTTILTNAQGRTLYYFMPDTASNTVCISVCAKIWPPLLFTGTGTPTASASLPGVLGVVKNANGTQVTYNGHPLYTYSGDSAAGQMHGEGFAGKWFVVTPVLAKNKP